MRRKQRNWKKNDPIKYFNNHYSHIKSRSQLQKKDQGLYLKLLRIKKLDEILPEKREIRDWKKIDPVKYFKENCLHITSRLHLSKEDNGLYDILRRAGRLDEVLPETYGRDWSKIDLVKYFHKHFSYVTSRGQLKKEDGSFYSILCKRSDLAKVLPKKQRRDWSKINPVEYFKEHCSHIKNTEQLIKEDGGLYHVLNNKGKLDEVLSKQRNWKKTDPIEYFKEHCSHITSRKQLEKEDNGLYKALSRAKRLDEVLPSKNQLKKQALEKVIEEYVK